MPNLKILGGTPLIGEVTASGARNSALKLIIAAMFSNEDVIIRNVPSISNVDSVLDILRAIGGDALWVGQNVLKLNGSGISSFKIPQELGSLHRVSMLLAGPLVFRFGEAELPKPVGGLPINRFIKTWEDLGYEVKTDDTTVYLKGHKLSGSNVSFKLNTHMGTESAIFSSLFSHGDTYISNAAEEVEVDDTIKFCNLIGGNVTRLEPRVIKVTGSDIFKGAEFVVQPDKTDVVTFATAAIITNGNITINKVDKSHLLAFVNFLTKMECNFEFFGTQMRVWNNNSEFNPQNINTAPAPGFLPEWQPFATLLLTQANGISRVYDTIYTNRFSYIRDLNMMGADIKLLKPSEVGYESIISDDSYDVKLQGEPHTVATIKGPSKFKGTKILASSVVSGISLMLAALAAEGKTELTGYEEIEKGIEHLAERLISLGAKIEPA